MAIVHKNCPRSFCVGYLELYSRSRRGTYMKCTRCSYGEWKKRKTV